MFLSVHVLCHNISPVTLAFLAFISAIAYMYFSNSPVGGYLSCPVFCLPVCLLGVILSTPPPLDVSWGTGDKMEINDLTHKTHKSYCEQEQYALHWWQPGILLH